MNDNLGLVLCSIKVCCKKKQIKSYIGEVSPTLSPTSLFDFIFIYDTVYFDSQFTILPIVFSIFDIDYNDEIGSNISPSVLKILNDRGARWN